MWKQNKETVDVKVRLLYSIVYFCMLHLFHTLRPLVQLDTCN